MTHLACLKSSPVATLEQIGVLAKLTVIFTADAQKSQTDDGMTVTKLN